MSYDEHLISMAGGDGEPDLDQIQARVDAAEEGPWIVFGSLPQWENEEDLSFGPDNAPEVGTVTEGLGNADFIAHARTDVPALLAVVRSQQAKIERVEAVASDLAERGERIEEKFERNGNGSIYSTRQEGRGIGCREAARTIRAALTATEGAA